VRAVLDGELVSLDKDGKPDFPTLCEAVLLKREATQLTYMVFDLLRVDGRDITGKPYSERRGILGTLRLNGPRWRTPEAFDDGEALWEAVCEHELEGVVAKRQLGKYMPGERGWVKTKNRAYWRYEMEREGAIRSRRPRQFVRHRDR
jgi:bifunctional non-homologous end joining protein LigD